MDQANGVMATSPLERLIGRIVAVLVPESARMDADAGLPSETGHSGVLRLPNNANFQDWVGNDEGTAAAPKQSNGGSR